MGKIYIFTFCVYIGKHSKDDLLKVLNLFINSLDKNKNNYELQIFTNFDLNLYRENIIINKYFDNNQNFFNNNWLNLSWNKINIYKYLYDKYNINYLWMDLDTIVTSNIEYINEVNTYFITIGGNCQDLHSPFINDNKKKYLIPTYKYIQGNVWKLNIDLYNKLISTFNDLNNIGLKLMWDFQTLITYYAYFIINENFEENNIYISSVNYKLNVLNSLSIWDEPNKHQHGNLNGLNNMYYEDDKLVSKFYPDKEIHIVSFTFATLIQLYNTKKFQELFINN